MSSQRENPLRRAGVEPFCIYLSVGSPLRGASRLN